MLLYEIIFTPASLLLTFWVKVLIKYGYITYIYHLDKSDDLEHQHHFIFLTDNYLSFSILYIFVWQLGM